MYIYVCICVCIANGKRKKNYLATFIVVVAVSKFNGNENLDKFPELIEQCCNYILNEIVKYFPEFVGKLQVEFQASKAIFTR